MDNMNQGTGHYNMDNMNQGTGHTMLVSSSSNLFTFFAVGTGTASGGDCTSAVESGDRSPDLPPLPRLWPVDRWKKIKMVVFIRWEWVSC